MKPKSLKKEVKKEDKRVMKVQTNIRSGGLVDTVKDTATTIWNRLPSWARWPW